ncbi:MAG: response regulator transcription factor [Planctomycetales bacterium]|jgi:two-component system OmpR family response regulator
MKILIVEDEEALAKGLKFNFEQEGYEVETAGDGHRALDLFDAADPPFDLILMDLMLPGMSGYETTREIRERDEQVSILVLSARTLSEDRAMAFDAGTDQYLSKPFALPELLSRVRNLTNRRQARTTSSAETVAAPALPARFEFGDGIVADFDQFELTVGDTTHTLTTMEMQLLRYFIEQESRVLSRDQIMENVWEDTSAFSTRSIDNFVMRLRRLIEPVPSVPRHFLSVRGTGYRFVANPEPGDEDADSENPESPG